MRPIIRKFSKMVLAAGHTVGSHTWSHADLQAAMKKGGLDAARDEMEKGMQVPFT